MADSLSETLREPLASSGLALEPMPWLRPFRALVFDWDGTAVMGRSEKSEDLARLLSQLLRAGRLIAIVTGTSLEKIQAQCMDLIPAPGKENLFVCANRGSEVFRFDESGKPSLVYRRMASETESAALDASADAFQREAEKLGLPTQVVRNRLNRRKIDLIPEPAWADPKKSEFAELLAAVQARLNLRDWIHRAFELSRECGLSDPRITSDIKHIEIGITDKSDSARWFATSVLGPRGIMGKEVLVMGDEFGTLGGVPGSDSLLRIPELDGALYLSVGVEPEGVPAWVIHQRGGPTRFREILRALLELVKESSQILLNQVDPDPAWSLEQEGFEASRERDVEPLFTLGNGSIGVRGSLSLPIPSSEPDLFVAGVYDRKSEFNPYSETEFLGSEGREDAYTEIASLPSPFHIGIRHRDAPLSLRESETERFRRILDFRSAMLIERMEWKLEKAAQLIVRVARTALLNRPHLLLQEIELRSGTGSRIPELELDAVLSRSLEVPAARHPHLKISQVPSEFGSILLFETSNGIFRVAIGARNWRRGESCGEVIPVELESHESHESEETFLIQRAFSVHSTRDSADPVAAVREDLASLSMERIRSMFVSHQDAWRSFWEGSDIELKRRPELTEAQRFNSFQVRVAGSEDPWTSIGARGLSGRAYEGHVFWDTEIFILPFLLHSEPSLARARLDYRYHTLEGARRRARNLGFEGACYAWESTVTGDDVTPRRLVLKSAGKTVPIFTGDQQIHVNADIAYAVARYWEKTGDGEWMRDRGVVILIETARFWRSRVTERAGVAHILRVVGPDEYHHSVDDNAYTNWMARYNLRAAAEACRRLGVGVSEAEIRSWEETAARIYFPKPSRDGVIEQFRGFFDLKLVTIYHEERLKAPVNRLLEWDQVNHQQLIKQADVLMIPFLFPDAFPKEIVAANFDYYEPRTDHGSSLSPCVHAAVASRIGEWRKAIKLWQTGLQLDLLNLMHNTALGVHLGNMGGTWQAFVLHMLSIDCSKDGCAQRIDPSALAPGRAELMRELGEISVRLRVRDQTIRLDLRPERGEEPWKAAT